ncbi:MAG TPA: acylglycerol kinase family protein, partial [Anaerolineae bacterium]|nr:acylglycerol kinase family protein [Anaerolineae bacterium]
MTRYKIIANPAAGGGAGARAIPRIERLLDEHGLDFDVVRTERPWHAAELAKEAAVAGCDVVVAAGGDGTANEVLNGLMEAKLAGKHSFAMGILSVGRGNDFAHGVGVPYEL